MWTAPPPKIPTITNEVIENLLDLKFRCEHCDRPEVSLATRSGHGRYCKYLSMVQLWLNPDDSDDSGPPPLVCSSSDDDHGVIATWSDLEESDES